MALRLLPFIVAAVLLAAHFLRVGSVALVAACLGAPLLLLHRRRRALRLSQLLAYGAAAVWIQSGLRVVQARLMSGQPWKLAAAILGGVALFTLIAGLLLNSRTLRERYPV